MPTKIPQIAQQNTEIARLLPLLFVNLAGGLILSCNTTTSQQNSSAQINFIGQSPIAPGIYVGPRQCEITINGMEETGSDTSRFTIGNDGLAVLNGETIRIGLVNTFNIGDITQSSIIKAITVTNEGFTIDWDTTITISGTTLMGFTLESWRIVDENSFEFTSQATTSATGILNTEE